MRLIPAQYVKPFLKTNKSDYIDAEEIAEAMAAPSMRLVLVKSDEQLDMQSLHRVRGRWIMRRTAVVNQIRGVLLERGITLWKGRCHSCCRSLEVFLCQSPAEVIHVVLGVKGDHFFVAGRGGTRVSASAGAFFEKLLQPATRSKSDE